MYIIVSFIIILVLFSIFKISGNEYIDSKNYRKYYRKNKYYKRYNKTRKERIQNITEQRLANMNDGEITTKRIMNIEESKIYFSIQNIFKDFNIYKQVSFKAFLDGEENTDVWKAFRDFYCDFLITHKKGNRINEPIAVIEYNGAGHFGNNYEMNEKIKNNDMIKEKLIKKVGMKYFIIDENDIKTNSKFIDNKKLEHYLKNIEIQLKNNL